MDCTTLKVDPFDVGGVRKIGAYFLFSEDRDCQANACTIAKLTVFKSPVRATEKPHQVFYYVTAEFGIVAPVDEAGSREIPAITVSERVENDLDIHRADRGEKGFSEAGDVFGLTQE